MIHLILSVLCSASLLFCFSFFDKKGIDTFQAIVVNYITCVVLGSFFADFSVVQQGVNTWLPWAIALGCLFITIFFMSGKTAQTVGVSVATISMKLAVVFPVMLGFLFYKEAFSIQKIIGIFCAIVAVFLCSMKEQETHIPFSFKSLRLPLIVWIGSGFCDSIVQYTKLHFFEQKGFEEFILIVFGVAAILGFIKSLFNKETWKLKNVLGGILLGIPNYGSMYFLFKAIIDLKNNYQWDSSVVFPINNISIVLVSFVGSYFLLKEKISPKNWIGVGFAITSIVLISFAA